MHSCFCTDCSVYALVMQAFNKHGVERFDPTGQPFDPNSHMALFKVPDPTKEPGTIAVVMKVCDSFWDTSVIPRL